MLPKLFSYTDQALVLWSTWRASSPKDHIKREPGNAHGAWVWIEPALWLFQFEANGSLWHLRGSSGEAVSTQVGTGQHAVWNRSFYYQQSLGDQPDIGSHPGRDGWIRGSTKDTRPMWPGAGRTAGWQDGRGPFIRMLISRKSWKKHSGKGCTGPRGHWPGLRQQHRQARTSSDRLRSSWHRVPESCRSQCPGFCTMADLMSRDLPSASRHQLVCRDKTLIRIIRTNHHSELMTHQPSPERHGVFNKEGNS